MHTGQDMDWRDKAFLITINVPDLIIVSDAPGIAFPACQAFRSSRPLIALDCPWNRWVAKV